MNTIIISATVLALGLFATACRKISLLGKPDLKHANTPFQPTTPAPNYADPKYWAALPSNPQNQSLCVPQNAPANWTADTANAQVDVFFIHPTTYKKGKAWNANINDKKLNQETDESTIKNQASVFNQECRIYAPRYRQAHLRTFYLNAPQNKALTTQALDFAYTDIKNAFEYYLHHYNQGRPIIIASHSQGTRHAKRLLQEYFDDAHKPLYNKLVAAYIIGYSVQPTDFNTLRVCQNEHDTQCIISWNTYEKGKPTPKWQKNAIAVNPLTWTTDPQLAPKNLHKGAVYQKFELNTQKITDAQINDHILWVSRPRVPLIGFLKGNYHILDYNLFYANIRENVSTRIGAYWKR